MKPLPTHSDETPTRLYNPDSSDFVFQYADDDNVQHTYVLHALESEVYPKYLADHAAGKLAEMLVWKRGIKTNYEDDKKKILEELYE